MTRDLNPQSVRDAVGQVEDWLRDPSTPPPNRAVLGAAVRLTMRALAVASPGGSVEVRVPPFSAVQCIAGPRHTRGTPPNVVETDPRTWLLVATGLQSFDAAVAGGEMRVSGPRAAELKLWLPLAGLGGEGRHRSDGRCPRRV